MPMAPASPRLGSTTARHRGWLRHIGFATVRDRPLGCPLMTTRLCQIIAIDKDVRGRAQQTRDAALAAVTKVEPLSGISRTYKPRIDGGDEYPPESKRVQLTVAKINERLAQDLGRLWDVTATKDVANTKAKADLVVDGVTLFKDLPGTHLVWLEKQLGELRGFFGRLPVLDPAELWTWDDNTAAYRSEPARNAKTRKVPKNHIRSEATKEHPAQVDVFTLDEPEGDWTTTKFSGAIPEAYRQKLLDRIDKLAAAVKFAREEANQQVVTDVNVGAVLFEWLLAS